RAHMPEAREVAELLHAQLLELELATARSAEAPGLPDALASAEAPGLPDAPASAETPRLPDALAEAFPTLARAYMAAPDADARLRAILDNYPV
ncbi:hypothetical protein VB151_20520, partial [Xanthomonas fragariae]